MPRVRDNSEHHGNFQEPRQARRDPTHGHKSTCEGLGTKKHCGAAAHEERSSIERSVVAFRKQQRQRCQHDDARHDARLRKRPKIANFANTAVGCRSGIHGGSKVQNGEQNRRRKLKTQQKKWRQGSFFFVFFLFSFYSFEILNHTSNNQCATDIMYGLQIIKHVVSSFASDTVVAFAHFGCFFLRRFLALRELRCRDKASALDCASSSAS